MNSLKDKEFEIISLRSSQRKFVCKSEDIKEKVNNINKYLCTCKIEDNKLCRSCKVILLEFGDWEK